MDARSSSELEHWERLWDEQKGEIASLHGRVADLEQRLSVLENRPKERFWVDDNPLILCLIDGDGYIFTKELLQLGSTGGQNAAKLLREGILGYLADNGHLELSRRGKIWLILYFNRTGLLRVLKENSVCSEQQFGEFIGAFHQASPLFSVVDVGNAKEAADAKIKECLRVFTRYPQTSKVFFGGAHDNGYISELRLLHHEGLLEKIVLLCGYTELAVEFRNFDVPLLSLDGVFMAEKLPSSAWSTPIKPHMRLREDFKPRPRSDSSVSSPAALPQSDERMFKFIHLRNFKPCATYYIMQECQHGMHCRFDHTDKLSPEQDTELRNYAKTMLPCPVANKNKTCSDLPCNWAHYCPAGPNCKRSRCNFKGNIMHSLPGVTDNGDLISSDSSSCPDRLPPLDPQSATSSPKLHPTPLLTFGTISDKELGLLL